MKAAIIAPGRDVSGILKQLGELDGSFKPEVWPDIQHPDQIEAALVWKVKEGTLKDFRNLKMICSFGAGVDHLLFRSSVPNSISITRLVDPALSKSVSKYCLMAIFAYEKNILSHTLNKTSKKWEWKEDQPQSAVGILGMGEMGKEIATRLKPFGYVINGYSASPKSLEGINHFHAKDGLTDFLKSSGILVNVMPLTPRTKGFFNRKLFEQCQRGTHFINLGRGEHVIDKDLLDAIDSGIISGATLDVFNEEPLPKHHPFWQNNKISITPHVAGLTMPESAAIQFYDNLQRLKKGIPVKNLVNRSRGY